MTTGSEEELTKSNNATEILIVLDHDTDEIEVFTEDAEGGPTDPGTLVSVLIHVVQSITGDMTDEEGNESQSLN